MTDTAAIEQVYVKIAGAYLSQTEMVDIVRVEVDSSFEMPDMCTVSLRDDDLQWLDGSKFAIGKAIEIEFTDAGGKTGTVMKGEITSIEPYFDADYSAMLTVRGYDKSHRLNRGAQSKAWLKKTDDGIAKAVSSDGGVTMTADATSGGTREHVFQDNMTNLAFIHQLARVNGFEVYADGDKLQFKKASTSRSSTVNLAWGEGLREFRPRVSAAGQVNEVNVRGWDPKQKKAIIGKATSSKVNPSINMGGSGGDVAKKAFGSAIHVEVRRPVDTQKQANAVAQAILDEINAGFIEADGLSEGNADIISGVKVKLSNLGTKFSGTYLVTSARHVYAMGRYTTDFTVTGMRPRLVSEMVAGASITATEIDRWNGVVPAIVTNINDPDDMGRVKVKYPWLDDKLESGWARVSMLASGGSRGFHWLPEVNDEVLVAFEQGDFNYPYVIGSLYNGKDKVPDAKKHAQNGKVEVRTLKTRAGHLIRFTDKSGEEKIEIIDGKTNTKIVLDQKEKQISITSKGKVVITTDAETEITAKKDVKVTTKGKATINSTGAATIDAKGAVTVKSAASMTIQATGALTLKGASITIQATGAFTIKSNASGTIQSSGILNVQGSILNLN
jgi:phage protein D/phage baseplate assembly protein gpV